MSHGIISNPNRFDLAQSPEPSAARRGRGIVGTFLAAIGRAWRRRRDRSALATLDDRALSDIGIGAGGIDHALRHGRDAGRRKAIEPGYVVPSPRGW